MVQYEGGQQQLSTQPLKLSSQVQSGTQEGEKPKETAQERAERLKRTMVHFGER